MSVVLGDAFDPWWRRFDGGGVALAHWETPVLGDMADAQQVHLAGLNLSRAWCLRELAPRADRAQGSAMLAAADAHEQVSAPLVAKGDFIATHWLVTFALLAAVSPS